MGREGAGGQGEKKVLVTWPVLAWWMRHWWIRFAATEEFHSCPNWLGKEGAAGNKYPSLCLLCSLNLCWSHPCLIITGREGRVARVRPHRAASLGSVGRELRVDLEKGANKTQSAQFHLFLHWFPSSYFRPLIFTDFQEASCLYLPTCHGTLTHWLASASAVALRVGPFSNRSLPIAKSHSCSLSSC